MIKAKSLCKIFGTTTAIEDVSFDLAAGEVLGFLGPNGAGKTTTMRILTCYMPPTSGHAEVAGFDVLTHSLEIRRLIGYLPEGVPLYRDMTVRSYLSFVVDVKGYPRSQRKKFVESAMEQTGLTDVAGRLVGHLSKGYRQRTGLAQAILGDPQVLILDEPTIGLDPQQVHEVRSLIKQMAHKRTVILSTHILPEVSMTCNRVLIINRGRIVAQGTPEKLTSDLQKEGTVRLTVVGPIDEIQRKIAATAGVADVKVARKLEANRAEFEVKTRRGEDVRSRIANGIVGSGWDLLELHAEGLTLEEIFLRVIATEKEEQEDAA
ncbi:ATP-binding cassette domain-containing protein [Candidatus Sumerlaeota bacterium]|nr:ATP-binding cassette domain-containing protein [Candidatus Sumerlaeota bacterium]